MEPRARTSAKSLFRFRVARFRWACASISDPTDLIGRIQMSVLSCNYTGTSGSGQWMRREDAMRQKAFSLVAGLIFFVASVLHILRLMTGWHVVFADWTIPISTSWIAFPIARYLGFEGLRLSAKV